MKRREDEIMLLFDGHLDLAMNALVLNRDLTQRVHKIRSREIGMSGKGRGMGTVAFPEMRKGEVAVCLATILARVSVGDTWANYNSPENAYAAGQGQLAYYRVLERKGIVRIIKDQRALETHVQDWESPRRERAPLGFIIAMEGADAIMSPENLEDWYNDGVRVVSLVHYDSNAYAHGTGSKGALTREGRKLLERMDALGVILDTTHLCEESFWEALDVYTGPLIASHNNCRALVPGDRQFSDEQIRALAKRDAVIGVSLDAWMLYPGWIKGKTPNTVVGLDSVIDQIEHMRRVAGSRNIGIGSDLDGGFGKEQCPHDLDSIADLQRLPQMLSKRGYTEESIKNIMHVNWLRLFGQAWSKR